MPTQNIYDLVDTWNAGATTFTAIKMNVTDTASSASSLLMDLQVGGVSRFNVSKTGVVTALHVAGSAAQLTLAGTSNGGVVFGSSAASSGAVFVGNGGTPVLEMRATSQLGWSPTSSPIDAQDLILTRRAAANLRLGAADAAAPVAQTLSVQSVVAGTTNTAGANLTITGSQGTGTGAGGSIVFQVAPAGSSGTAQNALATALTIDSTGAVTIAANGRLFIGSTLAVDVFSNVARLGSGTSGSVLSGAMARVDAPYFAIGSAEDTRFYRDAANTLALRNGANAQTFRVYNTTDGTNSEFGSIKWNSNVLQIGVEATGSGSASRNVEFVFGGTTRLTITATNGTTQSTGSFIAAAGFGFYMAGRSGIQSVANGQLSLTNNAGTDFDRLQFGGTTSSFPALKRSSTTLQARLADDSAFATIQGKLRADVNAVAETPTATHTITITDAAGTAYKVLCVAA